MKTLPEHRRSCKICRAAWPSLIEATLRGARSAEGACREAQDHLAACSACAAGFADILALVTWREAQAPFNADALPLATRRFPPGSEGVLRDCATS